MYAKKCRMVDDEVNDDSTIQVRVPPSKNIGTQNERKIFWHVFIGNLLSVAGWSNFFFHTMP